VAPDNSLRLLPGAGAAELPFAEMRSIPPSALPADLRGLHLNLRIAGVSGRNSSRFGRPQRLVEGQLWVDAVEKITACSFPTADKRSTSSFASGHPAIFVRQVAGRDQPITSSAIQKVIKRACCRIGLPHHSAHALRHTLACRLVENGSTLKEVADVLRHRSLNTTLIYAKLDTAKLAAVALPWPGSQS
jgi:hypothetical protein